jgi:hypothetical protein
MQEAFAGPGEGARLTVHVGRTSPITPGLRVA